LPKSRAKTEQGLPARRSRRKEQPTPLYAERRRELLAAAALTFRDLGYQAANLGDVAKRAGVNRASVYYYFSTKEDVLIELISGPLLLNTRRMGRIVRGSEPAAEKVAMAIRDLMSSFDYNYPALTIYFEERFDHILAKSESAQHRNLLRAQERYLALWRKLLEQGREAGELRFEGSPRIATFIIIGMIMHTSRWYRAGGGMSGEQIGAVYTRTILDGMLPR
jgi:AcrR family transcriptional regulator